VRAEESNIPFALRITGIKLWAPPSGAFIHAFTAHKYHYVDGELAKCEGDLAK